MRGPWNNDELLVPDSELFQSLFVQPDNRHVVAADDEQGRRLDASQGLPRQVRAAAARDDRADGIGPFRRGYEGSPGTGAGAEVTDRLLARLRLRSEPVGGADEPLGEEIDVEAEVCCVRVHGLFIGSEQIDEQSSEAG